ncbi:formate/nitrite transporter family protein [Pelotomaculum propionicicum]|uniref:Putative formate transporter 1 n=1 Tax=Pelotomaculum propionicicum TaxID=258475 RepID=A0A4Y7RIE8_9FIRM|nr:formate/nitrite transporter family protein [Pelotomaculum propionicicum]TEB08764.1 putative formate transporter 1 [Pelotomaculum propionicicum]
MANPPVMTVCLAGNAGKYKMGLPVGQLLLRGFMSGVYIAVGAALCTVCGTEVAKFLGAGFGKLIGGAVFPVGLIATVLTGMELFTGDAMLGPLAVMMGKTGVGSVIKNWVFVYIGNFIGSMAWAYLMVLGPFTQGNFTTAEPNAFALNAVTIAVAKTLPYKSMGDIGWWSCLANGIGCNFLVNLAILLGITAKEFIGKFFGIWFPIMAFVSIGFEHCVANMYFLPAGLMVYQSFPKIADKVASTAADGTVTYWSPLLHKFGGLTWGDVWLWNIIPATIGNIIGGMVFIGVVYFLCYRNEFPEEHRPGYQSGASVGK